MAANLVTQVDLFGHKEFPQTRYQGSKYKLRNWIGHSLESLDFETAIDAFSGTCSIAYKMKEMGKKVFCNDILRFNYEVGKALIENSTEKILPDDIEFIFSKQLNKQYDNFISRTFPDIYYLDEENSLLDIIVQNILTIKNDYKRAVLLWALFQACISKRPYNLFHRKNLYVRTSDVERNFGNKATWDKSFLEHYRKFAKEINNAIFSNGKDNVALCGDILEQNIDADLVYIDPPYIPKKGTLTQYGEFYHFLDGICDYGNWDYRIDYESKHRKLKQSYSIWEDKTKITNGFEKLIEKYKRSILAISYRSDGIPEIDEIIKMLKRQNKKVRVETIDYKYVLSTKNESKEVLIIGE